MAGERAPLYASQAQVHSRVDAPLAHDGVFYPYSIRISTLTFFIYMSFPRNPVYDFPSIFLRFSLTLLLCCIVGSGITEMHRTEYATCWQVDYNAV